MNRKQMAFRYASHSRQAFWIFIFLLFPIVVSAQQATKADIQALELKLTQTITETDKRLSNQIAELDKRLTNQIADLDKRLTGLQTTVSEMDKRLTNQISEMDRRMTTQISEMDRRVTTQISVLFWAIGALIALVLAVIALPQLLGYLQERRARVDFQKRIDELEQRLEQYHQEVEALKSQGIVTPS